MNLKLYDKNLTSLDALRAEKRRLAAEANSTAGNILRNKKHSSDSSDFDISDAINAGIDIITSKGAINKLLAISLPLLDIAGIKLEKKLLTSVSKEVLGGYIKWKAIEIGMSALSSYLSSRKDD